MRIAFGSDHRGLELKNRIEAELGISMSMVTLLKGPSVADLSKLLIQNFSASGVGSLTMDKVKDRLSRMEFTMDTLGEDEAAALLSKLPDLSDDEVENLLLKVARSGQIGKES